VTFLLTQHKTQYVLIVVVILVLVLTRIFAKATVSYSEPTPTYARFLELREDEGVSSLKCDVTNNSLVYGTFTKYEYAKAEACEWVKADIEKSELILTKTEYVTFYEDDARNRVVRRDLLGNISACKHLGKFQTCQTVENECRRGHDLVERLFRTMSESIFPLNELLTTQSKLSIFVNSTLAIAFDSLLSGLEGPSVAVETWASKNMPSLYGFFGSLRDYVQGQSFRNGDETSDFYKSVRISCAVYNNLVATEYYGTCDWEGIGDGQCHPNCNNAYCLFDGGDCLTPDRFEVEGGSHSNSFFSDEIKYNGFAPLQIAFTDDSLNPNFDLTKGNYTEEIIDELKTLKDSNGNLLFDPLDFEYGLPYIDDYKSTWQQPSNVLNGVDPDDTCGNPASWNTAHEIRRPNERIEDYEQMTQWIYESSLRNAIFPKFGFPSEVIIPSGPAPFQNTSVFSCDALSRAQNTPGVDGFTTAKIKEWVNYTYAAFHYFKELCGQNGTDAGEWRNDCDLVVNVYKVSGIEQRDVNFPFALLGYYGDWISRFSEMEYAYFGSAARENSGGVKQLLLDAGIKRDSKGYNVEAIVDFESYYMNSGVSECTYSRRVGASVTTVMTVVLGLIGGVTTSVTVFGLVLYRFFRRKVLKRYKREISSAKGVQKLDE